MERMLVRAGLVAIVVVILLGGRAEARPIEAALEPGFSIRSGDWLAADGLGILLLDSNPENGFIAIVARGEIGVGGASLGLGLATNPFLCPRPRDCHSDMSDFLFGFVSLEARAEAMYGLTSWRRATYVGGQISLAGVIIKPSIGWMVDVRDPREQHFQVATGMGW